jgi:hypothetical protein
MKVDIKVINNCFYNNNQSIWITDYGQNFENFIIRNNIMVTWEYQFQWNYWSDIPSGQLHMDHNIFNTEPGEMGGTDYIVGIPAFIDATNHNFHLASNSIAVNTGSSVSAPGFDFDGLLRPQGTGYDVGPYEYNSGYSPPPQIDNMTMMAMVTAIGAAVFVFVLWKFPVIKKFW